MIRRTVFPFLLVILFLCAMSNTGAHPIWPTLGEDTASENSQVDEGLHGRNLNTVISPKIHLKAATFDPLSEEISLSPEWTLDSNTDYYIVQCVGPIQSHWVEEIQKTGADILGYIPDYAYILHIEDGVKETILNLPFVRWVGPYEPSYKIQSGLMQKTGELELNVQVFRNGKENLGMVRNELMELGGVITYNGEGNHIIRTKIDAQRVKDITFIPEVEWIDEYSSPSASMNNIRTFTGAELVHIEGFTGSGIVGEVKDSGIDASHPDFTGQIIGIDGTPTEEAHGTCAFGIVFSTGANNENAKGMLPDGKGVFCNWSVPRYLSMERLVDNWNGVFQSNSWSTGELDSNYTTSSRENDRAIIDHDITMLHSAGNSDAGVYPQSCSRDSVAKNVIAVGGLYHDDKTDRALHEWTDFYGDGATPSQGPASDGRIKPDLSGPFDRIYTTDAIVYTPSTGQKGYNDESAYHDNYGGTSGATPVVAGAVGLVYEMYKDNHFGNNPTNELPHASTVKAILIADAYQYDFSQANRYQQGWGGVDVENVYSTGRHHYIIDEPNSLATGESTVYTFTPTGLGPLKISLVWTDVPASAGANPALVNNLNLKVTDPLGTTYWGNYGLENSKWSSPGGSADSKNNVENVFISNPISGIWTLEVIGENIPLDGDDSTTPRIDQTYSLVASNALDKCIVEIINPTSSAMLHNVTNITGITIGYATDVDVKIDDDPWVPATGIYDWYHETDTRSFPDGLHTVYARAFNGTEYSEEESIEVWFDNSPPITTPMVGDPSYYKDLKWFVLPSTQFTLSPDDPISGVLRTWYRILYEGTLVKDWYMDVSFTLSWGEGNYTIEFYSEDNLGNLEDIKSINAYVDLSYPETDLKIESPKYLITTTDMWTVSRSTLFNMSYAEDQTGVAFKWYTIDDEYFEGEIFNLENYFDGQHYITWGSEDLFGHNETDNSITVFLDWRPPSTDYVIGDPKWQEYSFDPWVVNRSTNITFFPSDDYSGINFTWSTIDGEYFEGTVFTLDGYENGSYEIVFGAEDNVGNNISEIPITIVLDCDPPDTQLDFNGLTYHSSDGDYWNVTETTIFELTATDEYSMVKTIWYTIDGIYHEDDSFNLDGENEGLHFITYGSIDNLDQNEPANSLYVNLDVNPPSTKIIINGPNYTYDIEHYLNVTTQTVFTLISNDSCSGVDYTWYTIDGLYFEGTTFNLSGYREGPHTIYFGALDNLGKMEEPKIKKVYLCPISLSTRIEIEGEKYRMGVEDSWNVTKKSNFLLYPPDIHCGIDFTWYTIDGLYFEGLSFKLSNLDDGPHNITWGSMNNFGINETDNIWTVYLDTSPPEISIHIDDPKYREDEEDPWAVNKSTVFTIISLDNLSGVSRYWYIIDDVFYKGSSFTLKGYSEGFHTIVIGSEDNLGHNKTGGTFIIDLDYKPPSIAISIGNPNVYIDDKVHINSSTPISLLWMDSGINKSNIFYSLDGGKVFYIYTAPFTVPSTTSVIIYGGEDIVGNRAEDSILYVTVDNRDTDSDGIDDIGDDDDDDDGLPDIEEDLDQDGIVDKGETDPKNPDTDGDGYKDGVDAFALDNTKWNGEDDIIWMLLLVVLIIGVVVILFFFLIQKQRRSEIEDMQFITEEESLMPPPPPPPEEPLEEEVIYEEEPEGIPPPPPPLEEPLEGEVIYEEEPKGIPPPPPTEEAPLEEEPVEFEPHDEAEEGAGEDVEFELHEDEVEFEPEEEQVEMVVFDEMELEHEEEEPWESEEKEAELQPEKDLVEWIEEKEEEVAEEPGEEPGEEMGEDEVEFQSEDEQTRKLEEEETEPKSKKDKQEEKKD
ncbi:MAG: S8 family serine peptidase [Methanomassiliicoccales archaeon]|nr:MAG: S8 family serine peptidase [Methanomassiliicoccales archaeon]